MSKKRALRLFLLLVVLSVILTGCGVSENEQGQLRGPGWVEVISGPLRLGVTFLNDNILTPIGIPSYGLAIILLTVLIRLLLYPLTKKQMDSMRQMQEIQPQLKELQDKYGKDREKFSQKQMELYKEHGINPAMGCLPMLLQMPILFGFYYALIGLGDLLKEPFLWIPDLSFPTYSLGGRSMEWLSPVTPDHLLSHDVWPYLVLPVFYILSQVVMQRMSQASQAGGSSSTNSVMMLMPFMFAYITLVVPSGLTLYWITSNLIQIVQQGMITGWDGLLSLIPGRAKPEAVAATPTTSSGPSSGFGGLLSMLGGGNNAEQQVEIPEPAPEPAPPAISAGRRRKQRKKRKK